MDRIIVEIVESDSGNQVVVSYRQNGQETMAMMLPPALGSVVESARKVYDNVCEKFPHTAKTRIGFF